eukprot:2446833-Pyramimonas_sp.AAC.1
MTVTETVTVTVCVTVTMRVTVTVTVTVQYIHSERRLYLFYSESRLCHRPPNPRFPAAGDRWIPGGDIKVRPIGFRIILPACNWL